MSLGHQNSENNDNSPPPNGRDDDRNRPRSARDYWTNCSLLRLKCIEVGAEIVSLRRAVVYQEGERGYKRAVGEIRITKSGEVTCSGVSAKGEVIKLTGVEKAMAAEVAAANFPKSEPAPKGSLPPKLKDGDPREYYDYVFRNAAGEVLFVERRFEAKTEGGKKQCLPWSYRDGRWWPEEPDALPLFGLDHLTNAATIIIHEGPKAARYWQEMISAQDDERRAALKKHPWGEVLKQGAHVGWAGGAYRAHHTDWSTLPRDARIVIIADNDTPGLEAAKDIARILSKNGHKGRVSVVRFNKKFPDGFDLYDPWPKHAKWWSKKGDYIGPSLMDLEVSTTWATDIIKVGKKEQPVIRDEFAKEWISVVDPGVFINRHQPHKLRTEQVFNILVRPFSDAKDTASLLRPVFSSQMDGLIYRPGGDEEVTDDGQLKHNLFRPSPIKPKQGDAAPFIEFMEYLIPDKDERHHLMRWVATLIGRPEERMTYGVLLVSETQGVGKSTLGGNILAPLVGMHNTSFPDEKEIINSEFNPWLAHKRLAVVNEIYAGQNHKAYERLQSLMTDPFVRVNDKHEKRYELELWIHIFACSNSRRALQIKDQDRRWLVPRVTETPRTKDYWRAFHAWLEDCGLPIVAHWAATFLKKHGEDAVVRKGQHAPMTAAKQEMIDESRTPGAQMAFDLGELVMARKDRTIIVANEVVA